MCGMANKLLDLMEAAGFEPDTYQPPAQFQLKPGGKHRCFSIRCGKGEVQNLISTLLEHAKQTAPDLTEIIAGAKFITLGSRVRVYWPSLLWCARDDE
jgi:hypothetical protein